MKPTKTARGGNYNKQVREKHYLQNISDAQTIRDLVSNPAKTKDEQFKQAVAVAHNTQKTINFLPEENGKNKAIVQITPKKSKKIKKTAKTLYSIKGKVQKLNKVPTLEPAGKLAGSKGGEIFINEAQRRLAKELSKGLPSG